MQQRLWILVVLLLGACATLQPSLASDPDEAAIRAARSRLNEALSRQPFILHEKQLL